MANIQAVIGRLATRERWLMAPLADMFIEPPELKQTRSGRTVQASGRWVVPMFRRGTDMWRTGDGTSKTTPTRQK